MEHFQTTVLSLPDLAMEMKSKLTALRNGEDIIFYEKMNYVGFPS